MVWDNTPHVTPSTRRRIRKRDNNTCQQCGTTNAPMEVDHINNQRGEGYDQDTNLQLLCKPCHATKTKKEAADGRRNRPQLARYPTEQHPGLLPHPKEQ